MQLAHAALKNGLYIVTLSLSNTDNNLASQAGQSQALYLHNP